ncbi:MAG: hypothetical protein MUP64_09785 [Anaerolineae bacterium]|nr:hypothetical protein [Anaerolineae bacterium]
MRDSWGITTTTKYHFTGPREESTIGLYFYNARWYDAALGRFISADALVHRSQVKGRDDLSSLKGW